MRKMDSSGKTLCSVALSACAVGRSRPKGFSTMTRASLAQPELASPCTTLPNMLGGMAR